MLLNPGSFSHRREKDFLYVSQNLRPSFEQLFSLLERRSWYFGILGVERKAAQLSGHNILQEGKGRWAWDFPMSRWHVHAQHCCGPRLWEVLMYKCEHCNQVLWLRHSLQRTWLAWACSWRQLFCWHHEGKLENQSEKGAFPFLRVDIWGKSFGTCEISSFFDRPKESESERTPKSLRIDFMPIWHSGAKSN